MDKVKIRSDVAEVKEVINELVADGNIDGDQGKQLLFSFTEEVIRKEMIGNAEVG